MGVVRIDWFGGIVEEWEMGGLGEDVELKAYFSKTMIAVI